MNFEVPDHPDIISAERTGYGEGQTPNLVGPCEACHAEMYAHKAVICVCDKTIHTECVCVCPECDTEGCKCCMVIDKETGEYFCDISETGKLSDSECWQEWTKDETND